MRLLLLAFALLLLPLVWFSGSAPEGLGVLTAYVAPSLVTLMFFVLALDALMNRVFMVDQGDSERRPLRLRLRADLLAIALLLVFWGPYYYRLIAMYGEG